MEQVVKAKGLTAILREMKIGQTLDIQPTAYKINSVYSICRRLRSEGKDYKVTEKGLITGCHVTRMR